MLLSCTVTPLVTMLSVEPFQRRSTPVALLTQTLLGLLAHAAKTMTKSRRKPGSVHAVPSHWRAAATNDSEDAVCTPVQISWSVVRGAACLRVQLVPS